MEPPFDTVRLENLLEEARAELLLATSKHNVRYLLGGYQYHFYSRNDAIGTGRYLPVVGYRRGRPDQSFYIANAAEGPQQECSQPLWVAKIRNYSWTGTDAAEAVAEELRIRQLDNATIAVEKSWLPMDVAETLSRLLSHVRFVDAGPILDELRAIKQPYELEVLRYTSESIVAAMAIAARTARPGSTRADVMETVKLEETRLGLDFNYCLVSAGTNLNRTPAPEPIDKGWVFSMDSGGSAAGYIGDMTRMGILGEPDQAQCAALGEIRAVQDAARARALPGAPGGGIFEGAVDAIRQCTNRRHMGFLAHGMGVSHNEAPWLTSSGPIPYLGKHAMEPLRPGMVLSIETHIASPELGFIKLEDTVVITPHGHEAYGDVHRDWIRSEA